MNRLLVLALVFASATATADTTKGPAATLPKAGDSLGLTGAADWPKLTWMYDSPSTNDAAGKIVIHWFCAPRIASCKGDLDRLISLRDTNHVYIVAYINGGQADAKKLDPIRESEGVGRGTVAFGPNVAKLAKQLGVTEGAIVVDVDGRVKAVTTSGDLNELDARDKVVTGLIDAIKVYTASYDSPKTAKPNEKFPMTIKISLAAWLKFKADAPSFALTVPKDVKCDKATKVEGNTLTATATCTAPKGVYEAQGKVSWGYTAQAGGDGLGEDGTTFKFEIK